MSSVGSCTAHPKYEDLVLATRIHLPASGLAFYFCVRVHLLTAREDRNVYTNISHSWALITLSRCGKGGEGKDEKTKKVTMESTDRHVELARQKSMPWWKRQRRQNFKNYHFQSRGVSCRRTTWARVNLGLCCCAFLLCFGVYFLCPAIYNS